MIITIKWLVNRLLLPGIFLIHFSILAKPVCISLGGACGPALTLRDLHIRTEAYPFDWIVSPFESLYAALTEDFEHFLTALRVRPDNQGVIDHYGFHFTHDWPNTTCLAADSSTDFVNNGYLFPEWEAALPAIKEKYERRINRFKQACLSKDKVYFIRWEESSLVNLSQKDLAVVLRNYFEQHYPDLDFCLIVISSTSIYKEPWNIDKIKNFYSKEWHDPLLWAKFLIEVDPDFKDIIDLSTLTKSKHEGHTACCQCHNPD